MRGWKLTSRGRLKDVNLRTSFGDVFSLPVWHFEYAKLTFQYFMQHIWWNKIVKKITTVMCLVIFFSKRRHFGTLLGHPCGVSATFLGKCRNSCCLLPGGTLKQYFKNVGVINHIDCVKIDVLGTSLKRHTTGVTSGRFFLFFWGVSQKILCRYRGYVLCFPLYFYLYI